jgi:pyruvate/2-oxoglutarate dehydrogenase complex dihydrolipoamide dehydrogenase (E3) component
MRFDVAVIGMGPGGEHAAYRLIAAGKKVAVIERELIGGECSYWACMPSKTLIRPPEARGEARRAAGVGDPSLSWAEASAYRDMMVRNYDDAKQVKSYEEQGATVFKGDARLAGRASGSERGGGAVRTVVEVGDERIEATDILLATGSEPTLPPMEGLDEVGAWTNREATGVKEIPERTIVIGAGPVGLELAQMLARYGSNVALVQKADRLLDRETAEVSKLLAGYIAEDGVEVHAGKNAVRARREGDSKVVEFEDGSELSGDVIVVATGRRPRVKGLGLESIGVNGDKGVPIDERCRVTEGVWALGDVTAVSPFTHVAKYQGRIVSDNILGRDRVADYRAIPRVVFCDPEIAAVGLTEEQARDQGMDVATATVDLAALLARPITYEENPRGHLGLVANRATRTLVGAWAVSPLASEWIHQAVLGVKAQVPIDVLLDTVAQFPSYSEGYLSALEKLDV